MRARSDGPRLLVGLGNPGEEYRLTRHNIGFRVIDTLRVPLKLGEPERFHRSELGMGRRRGGRVVCLKPGLFMNLSGGPTEAAMERYELKANNVLVIYDDLDLPLGRLRLRAGGSSGGHRGVESVIQHIGAGFHRLRIGIGRPVGESEDQSRGPVVDHVLEPFEPDEVERAEWAREQAAEAALCWLDRGLQETGSRFNGVVFEENRPDDERAETEDTQGKETAE